jgi:predicted TIM-barrel fold metal-dependent hydrolase
MLRKADCDKLRKEILGWLPDNIIDAHVHTGIRAEKITEREEKFALPYSWLKNKAVVSAKKDVFKEVYPGIGVEFVGIPLTFDVMDPLVYNNELAIAEMKKGIACELWGLNDTELLEESMANAKKNGLNFCGIKFHPRMVKAKAKENIRITDMIKEDTFEFVNKKKLAMTLELANGFCKEDVATLERLDSSFDFKIVLAHMAFNNNGFTMSRNEYMRSLKENGKELEEEFSKIAGLGNVYLDSSMIIDKRIIEGAISALGGERVMYGTDFPFGFTPKIKEERPLAKEYAEDLKKVIDIKPLADRWKFDYNIYLMVKALKDAETSLKLDIADKVMFANAKKVFAL